MVRGLIGFKGCDPIDRTLESGRDQRAFAVFGNPGVEKFELQFPLAQTFHVVADRSGRTDADQRSALIDARELDLVEPGRRGIGIGRHGRLGDIAGIVFGTRLFGLRRRGHLDGFRILHPRRILRVDHHAFRGRRDGLCRSLLIGRNHLDEVVVMDRFGFSHTDQEPVFDRFGGKCRQVAAIRIQNHAKLIGITEVANALDPLGFDIDFLKAFVWAVDVIDIENDTRGVVHGKGGIIGNGTVGQNDDLDAIRLFLEIDHFDACAFSGRLEHGRVNGFRRRRRWIDGFNRRFEVEILVFNDDVA